MTDGRGSHEAVCAGGILNEQEIMEELLSGRLEVTPIINPRVQLGPTSLDTRLGFEFEVFNKTRHTHIDPLRSETELQGLLHAYTTKVHVGPMHAFILHPGEFALASTLEYMRIPSDLAARIEGRSTWARLGLQVHSTAGFIDPGFEGVITYELRNVGSGPICLYPGVRLAQLCFFRTRRTCIPYVRKPGAKYHRKLGTSGSRFYADPEFAAIRRHVRREEEIMGGREDDLEKLLGLGEEALLVQLGQYVSGEARKGIRLNPGDAARAAAEWLGENRERLSKAVCGDQTVVAIRRSGRAREDVVLAAAMCDAMASLVMRPPLATVGALLALKGLDWLCGRGE